MVMNVKTKIKRKNFRTWRWQSIILSDLCGSLSCASSAAWWTSDTPCVNTKSKQRRSFLWFSVETMVKATKPTGIAGPLLLAKKCHARGKLATGSIFHWCKDLAEKRDTQRHGQLLRLAYVKVKTTKISSKVNTAFSQNIAPAKVSRYTVHPLMFWLSLVFDRRLWVGVAKI